VSENTFSEANSLALLDFPWAVMHLDCDAFFTSVEQALNPQYQGKPMVTGKERGIVACASYEAKRLGVKRPMILRDAMKICPGLIALPSDYETYSLYSKRVFAIIRKYTPDVEEYSIDEAFADLSGLRRLYRSDYAGIARRIKEEVQSSLGLTVTVGLSLSKSLAKIASKHEKPNGFTVVPGREIETFLKGMPLERVCGFGPNTTALLKKRGVRDVLDYIHKPEAWAKQVLGKIGLELWHELRGQRIYPIQTEEKHDYDTISKTKTFTPASSDRNFVWAQLVRNMESAFIKLRRHKLRTKRICVVLRSQDFRSEGVEAELVNPTPSTMAVTAVARALFDKVFDPKLSYRTTSIILSDIEADVDMQYTLFEDTAEIQKMKALDRVIDEVNEKYGKHCQHLGTSLWLQKHAQHVNDRGDVPARKKDLLKGETKRQHLSIPVWKIDLN